MRNFRKILKRRELGRKICAKIIIRIYNLIAKKRLMTVDVNLKIGTEVGIACLFYEFDLSAILVSD